MKNNRRSSDSDSAASDAAASNAAALGPEPAVPQSDLSPAVAFVHEHLASQAGAVTISALAAMTGLHQNTVREHLDQLVEAGAATKTKAASTGRGRPAWLYRATGAPRAGSSEYLGLASVLAAQIDRTSAEPRADGIAAGLDWGRDLAREAAENRADTGEVAIAEAASPASATEVSASPGAEAAMSSTSAAQTEPSAVDETLALLEGLGFAPETAPQPATAAETAPAGADMRSFRLTRCPLLEAAHEYPDIVCGVHLGLVRGALDVFGDPDAETRLDPFSEPGACRLHMLDSSAGPAEKTPAPARKSAQ